MLVGAGPGNAGLMTLQGLRALQEADVIVHDRLVSAEVLDLARRDAARFDVGKFVGGGGATQEEINKLLVEHAQRGEYVVRLKGGDPFVFGRGGEEIDFLRAHGVSFEVIPGITAAIAAGAYAGVPLTDRRYAQAVRFLTGNSDEQLAQFNYLGSRRRARNPRVLHERGQARAAARQTTAVGRAAATCPWRSSRTPAAPSSA